MLSFKQSHAKIQAILDNAGSGGGGTGGTTDYTELENKPQINSVTLSGNKTTSDLGIDEVPEVTSSDDGKVLTAHYGGIGGGSYSEWQLPTLTKYVTTLYPLNTSYTLGNSLAVGLYKFIIYALANNEAVSEQFYEGYYYKNNNVNIFEPYYSNYTPSVFDISNLPLINYSGQSDEEVHIIEIPINTFI